MSEQERLPGISQGICTNHRLFIMTFLCVIFLKNAFKNFSQLIDWVEKKSRKIKDSWDILCSGSIMIILMSCLILPAGAETISYCDSIPLQLTDWNSSVTLPKFNPEMGTLTGVDIKSVLNLSQGILVENFNNKPVNYSVTILGRLLVELPRSETMSININHSSEGQLAAFDDDNDFSGPSGTNLSADIETEPAFAKYSSLKEFIAHLPDENLTLPVSIFITSLMEVPGSSSIGVRMKAGADVCISYKYDLGTSKEGKRS